MPGPIDEYFKRDLTEAEEGELSELLASSPEEAERFAGKMAAFHAELGQAVPEWSVGEAPSLRRSFPWVWTAMGILLLTGGFLFIRAMEHPQVQVPSAEVTSPLPALERQAPSPPRKSAQAPKAQGEAPTQEDALLSPRTAIAPPAPRHAIEPATPLPPLPGGTTQRLSVTVHRMKEGLATVRVVDAEGNPVRSLHAGILPAGSRAFTWDGKEDSGAVAAPGLYYLEVRSGTHVQKQELRLGVAE